MGGISYGRFGTNAKSVARPDAVVVDIDGDGSFILNAQELVDNLPIEIMLLNNHHLWYSEDHFYKANGAHTYLGNPVKR